MMNIVFGELGTKATEADMSEDRGVTWHTGEKKPECYQPVEGWGHPIRGAIYVYVDGDELGDFLRLGHGTHCARGGTIEGPLADVLYRAWMAVEPRASLAMEVAVDAYEVIAQIEEEPYGTD